MHIVQVLRTQQEAGRYRRNLKDNGDGYYKQSRAEATDKRTLRRKGNDLIPCAAATMPLLPKKDATAISRQQNTRAPHCSEQQNAIWLIRCWSVRPFSAFDQQARETLYPPPFPARFQNVGHIKYEHRENKNPDLFILCKLPQHSGHLDDFVHIPCQAYPFVRPRRSISRWRHPCERSTH